MPNSPLKITVSLWLNKPRNLQKYACQILWKLWHYLGRIPHLTLCDWITEWKFAHPMNWLYLVFPQIFSLSLPLSLYLSLLPSISRLPTSTQTYIFNKLHHFKQKLKNRKKDTRAIPLCSLCFCTFHSSGQDIQSCKSQPWEQTLSGWY